jgi:hypothetical protein
MTMRRWTFGYYFAAALLAVLLVGAVVLIVAMVMRPGPPPASVLAVTDKAPVPCPDHQKRVTCFETQVTNNGSTTTGVRCQIVSADGSQATFVSGSTTTQILLDVDQSVHLDSIVVTADDTRGDPPTVTCDPAQT